MLETVSLQWVCRKQQQTVSTFQNEGLAGNFQCFPACHHCILKHEKVQDTFPFNFFIAKIENLKLKAQFKISAFVYYTAKVIGNITVFPFTNCLSGNGNNCLDSNCLNQWQIFQVANVCPEVVQGGNVQH